MDFDWEQIGKVLATLIPIIIFLVFNIIFRKQQEQKKKLTSVRNLISEIDHNQKLIEAFSMQWQTRKFKTSAWKQTKGKMDYLDSGLRYILSDTYAIIEEYNREIDMAKKQKSASYLVNIRGERLTKPLAQSKEGLEEWLQLNKGSDKIFKRS